ncbi:hypothetical protein [Psychroserpens sp. Hel_I_66]|uniref:hypothetical protein n=1 Tax=Psychroserpens sp. Hel_I_66 TaxID=1250004 RepID=UPI00064643B9|nr:hypothetical protein [Psychroserpens sp. Hel_I_66]
MGSAKDISQLLEFIQSFQVVKCNMHHEGVAVDEDNHPIFRSENNTIIFKRINLCDPKLRSIRLGCAHSHSNLNFQNALDHLSKALPEYKEHISEVKKRFILIISKIYELDHKVGHLEHDTALVKIENDLCPSISMKADLQDLKLEHRQLMDQLLNIKTEIENLMAMAFINEHK